jgi:CheY-like chemotaxis protein
MARIKTRATERAPRLVAISDHRTITPLCGTHLPLIALTAHALKGDRERCLRAGMDGCLTKPIRGQELDAVLYRYTTRKSKSATPELVPAW